MSTLTLIIVLPFLAAATVMATPRSYRFGIRLVALAATFVTLLLGIYVFWRFDAGQGGYQFTQRIPWVEAIGISYHVGVDGINVGLVLMGCIVAFAATAVSWEIQEREKEFYALLLVMTGGILGAFASLDLFFFFFFHELALIPTFVMIGVWGRGEDKNYATFKITLYLSLGALVALAGLIGLYGAAGAETFDIPEIAARLKEAPLSAQAQGVIFPFLLFGFGILVSLWPFHTWAPLGYRSAPTATAMLHAGVLKKFGLYGLIRLALPFLPEAAQSWAPVVAYLALGNILLVGFVAMRQKDLGFLAGNSSVAHMGFVFLGIASASVAGVTGAVVVMVAHGLLAALTFGLVGYLSRQNPSLALSRMGGLLRQIPFIGTVLAMAMFAGCGLPGFANFVGEAMVFFGAWNAFPLATGLAVWGALVVGAVYMLRAIRSMLHGPVAVEWREARDASAAWRKAPFVLLLAALFLFGFFPRLLTDRVVPAATALLEAGRPADSERLVAESAAADYLLEGVRGERK